MEKKTSHGLLPWDEKTNLPALPDGQFWVVRSAGPEGFVAVQWMASEMRTRPRSWWGRVVQGKKPFTWEAEWPITGPVVFDARKRKLSEVTAAMVVERRAKLAARQESQKIVGRYPPKRAED